MQAYTLNIILTLGIYVLSWYRFRCTSSLALSEQYEAQFIQVAHNVPLYEKNNFYS